MKHRAKSRNLPKQAPGKDKNTAPTQAAIVAQALRAAGAFDKFADKKGK